MRNHLPKQFRFSHRLCMFLYQVIVGHLKDAEGAKVFRNVIIKFKDKPQAKRFNELLLKGEALWKWLDQEGFHVEMNALAYKQAVAALISDFCQFMYLALEASKAGNTTPAFSLLRKPLTDNLLMLEWLLGDPADFLRTFRKGGTIEMSKKLGRANKLMIIQSAIEKMKGKGINIKAQLLYDLRYEKSHAASFASIWNQSIHLITTNKFIRTEDHNINFIFSGEPERITQWKHLYERLPLLLNYSVDVVEALISTLAPPNEKELNLLRMQRAAGVILWGNRNFKSQKIKAPKEKMTCPSCGKKIHLDMADVELLFELGISLCPKCFSLLIGKVSANGK